MAYMGEVLLASTGREKLVRSSRQAKRARFDRGRISRDHVGLGTGLFGPVEAMLAQETILIQVGLLEFPRWL